MPLNALSENRTRIFTCRSSRGSNPVASVHWKLLTSVDYITSIPVSNISVPINRRTLDSLLSGTNEDHTFNPGEIADFDSKLMESQSKVDPINYGLIAFSEATLVSRPWYNGARVSCQLIWSPKENRNLTAAHTNKTSSSQTEYSKSVYLITEVIFAPTAVSLSAIPRNGIQENSGQQLLECITTSAIPAAQITWYRRKPAYNLGPTSSTTSTMHLQHATAEDPLQLTKEDILIQNGVAMEKLPGLYGGKRVVSRLHLSNISRIDDGVVYICKVTHVEWIRSIGRLHQLAVLFPPSLSIEITPSNWKRRIGSSVTLLHCIADGGRPKFPDHLEEHLSEVPSPQRQQLSLRKVHGQDRNLPVLDTHDDWKFTWFFRPSYPKQPVSASVLINNNSLQNFASVGDMVRTSDKNPSLLIIRNPEKSNAGAYTCRLDGPGGMVFKTTLVTFAFPPELVPSGATVFTAPTGFRAVLELHVWAFPHPLINTPMLEGYRTPRRENFCEIRQNASNHRSTSLNYTWFKVITTGSWPNVQITSRKQLTASDRQYTQSDTMPQQERIWSDVVLVNLATAQSRLLDTMVYRPQSGFMASENEMKIPTLVYRLFFPTVTAEDHGEYLCEVEHMLGKKAFLVKLQPPGAWKRFIQS
ncbi:unnamed protein product [Dicrocoelium dendriticum]|nr:unnamed protein product [Dicrocoelium dendriticum]